MYVFITTQIIGHIWLNLTAQVSPVRVGHSSIIKAKDFIKHNKSVEKAKKSGRYWAPFLAELELIWKLWEAKLEDVVELG